MKNKIIAIAFLGCLGFSSMSFKTQDYKLLNETEIGSASVLIDVNENTSQIQSKAALLRILAIVAYELLSVATHEAKESGVTYDINDAVSANLLNLD